MSFGKTKTLFNLIEKTNMKGFQLGIGKLDNIQ